MTNFSNVLIDTRHKILNEGFQTPVMYDMKCKKKKHTILWPLFSSRARQITQQTLNMRSTCFITLAFMIWRICSFFFFLISCILSSHFHFGFYISLLFDVQSKHFDYLLLNRVLCVCLSNKIMLGSICYKTNSCISHLMFFQWCYSQGSQNWICLPSFGSANEPFYG